MLNVISSPDIAIPMIAKTLFLNLSGFCFVLFRPIIPRINVGIAGSIIEKKMKLCHKRINAKIRARASAKLVMLAQCVFVSSLGS